MSALRDAAMNSKAWPFEEARAVLKRYGGKDPAKIPDALEHAIKTIGSIFGGK